MEIEGNSLNTLQGQVSLSMQKKSLDFTADMTNQLIQGSLEAADSVRAQAGIGTKVNLTV